jgi:hypothetical protein
MAIILKQIEDEQPFLLPIPIPARPVQPESAIRNLKLAKLAKCLDYGLGLDGLNAASPAKLRRIASRGGS